MAENNKKIRFYAAETAKNTLNLGENRLKLVVCIMICAVATVLAWLMSDLSYVTLEAFGVSASAAYYLTTFAVTVIFWLLLAAPLYMGTFKIALRMLRGESTEIADIFDVFASPSDRRRAFALSFSLLWRILPIIVVCSFTAEVNLIAEIAELSPALVSIVNTAFVPALVLSLAFAASQLGFVSFAYTEERVSVRTAIKKARKARKGNYKSVFALATLTLLKLLLSLLTLGILTVIHTLPMALLTYGAMAQELKDHL